MKRLRWKLLAAMIALVVVTLGISGRSRGEWRAIRSSG